MGSAAGANRYAYCNNNPVNNRDPSGMIPPTGNQLDTTGGTGNYDFPDNINDPESQTSDSSDSVSTSSSSSNSQTSTDDTTSTEQYVSPVPNIEVESSYSWCIGLGSIIGCSALGLLLGDIRGFLIEIACALGTWCLCEEYFGSGCWVFDDYPGWPKRNRISIKICFPSIANPITCIFLR